MDIDTAQYIVGLYTNLLQTIVLIIVIGSNCAKFANRAWKNNSKIEENCVNLVLAGSLGLPGIGGASFRCIMSS